MVTNITIRKSMVSLLVVALSVLCTFPAWATILPYHSRIATTSAPVLAGSNGTSTMVQVTQPWTGAFKDVSVTDRITFGVDHSNLTFVTLEGEVKVSLKIEHWIVTNTSATPSSTTFQDLVIDYQPFSPTVPYIDKSVFSFSGAYKYTITIVGITQKGLPISVLPVNLFVDADIMVERYYDFSINAATPISPIVIQPHNIDCDPVPIYDELEVSWPATVGAEEYQLEWTFVNDYDLTLGSPYKLSSALDYSFRNNSTRITTTNTSYKISLIYDHGYVLFRVRGVGRDLNNTAQHIVGKWSQADNGKVNTVSSKYHNLAEHEGDKNWQYSATYAEEGKLKEVISYFGGDLRNRQSVTRVNSDNNTIVGQTIYDHQGRPAINVLPVPIQIPTCNNVHPLQYYPGFNVNDLGSPEPYSRTDFDVDISSSDSCTATAAPMGIASGASNYYSPANPDMAGAQAFVPDGEKFPFTQVEYTSDNTGRIRRQGGVGPDYQLGSGHETKYFYGTPNQIQLDRLFGSEAGDQTHHKKNLVVDANGQVSVSYLDQEGRTIATSLAGDAPKDASNTTILAPLASEGNALDTLTIDLFSKNALGNSTNNTIDDQTQSIVFNSQLLVAYETEYEFDYALKINDFTDTCLLKKQVCLNCVYDLEIRVTDDCGRVVVPMPGFGIQPINKTIGYFTADANGDIVSFNTDCNGPSPYTYTTSFKLRLPLGNYTVSKILTVNSEARDFYVAAYLDTTYNDCVKTLHDFQQEALAKVDTSGCFIDCQSCTESLKTINGVLYSSTAEARDQYVAAGIGTELEFDFLMEQCGSPCKNITWCEATYQQLLLDVSPDGQYAQFQAAVDGKAPDVALSVLHVGNILPKAWPPISMKTDWQHPLLELNGTPYQKYIDDDGAQSIIHLSPDGGNFTPPVQQAKLGEVKYDPVGQFYYTYPQNLNTVSDFVAHWKESWAKSLVQYHPEYCYYESCRSYTEIQAGHNLTSDGFDSLLQVTNTFQDAATKGLVQLNPATIPSDINLMATFIFQPSLHKDPFLVDQYGAYNSTGTTLSNVAKHFRLLNGVYYSMVEIAANTARCGTQYGMPINAGICNDFGQGLNASILDQEWNMLKNFYLSEKRKIQQKSMDDKVKTSSCRGYNGCIGNDNYDPFQPGMFNFLSGWPNSSQAFNGNQPCSFLTMAYYAKKAKRFIGPDDIQAKAPADMEYEIYMKTGQCPLAFQYQHLLSALAAVDQLDNTIGTNLQDHQEFTPSLYKALNGGINPPAFIPYKWKATTASGNILSGNIVNAANTPVCAFVLDKSGTAIVNWDDITSISELTYTSTNGSNQEFKAKAAFRGTNGNLIYETIRGSTCFAISGCTFSGQNVTSILTKDLGKLMAALQMNGDLPSAAIVSLNTTFPKYESFLTTSIKSILGTSSNNLSWQFNSAANQYELFVGNTQSKRIVIRFLSFLPAFYSNNNLTSVKSFADIAGISQNRFSMKGLDVSGTSVVTIEGTLGLVEGQTYTPINTNDNSLPDPIACKGIEYQLRDDLEALLKDALLKRPFKSNINLFANPYFTSLIKSYFPYNVTGNSSFNPHETIGNNYSDTLIFAVQSESGSCDIVLYHNGVQPPRFFKDLTGFDTPLVPVGSFDQGRQKFYLVGKYKVNGNIVTDTIWGYSCLPVKYCDPCPKPKIDCITCKGLTIFPPDTICINRPLSFSFKTKGCSGNPVLMWNFGDGTSSTLATHTYTDPGNYVVTLYMVRSPGCPDLTMPEATIAITVMECSDMHPTDSVSWVFITIDSCLEAYSKYLEVINQYNQYVDSFPEVGLQFVQPISEEEFTANKYCHCLAAYHAYLQSLIANAENKNKGNADDKDSKK